MSLLDQSARKVLGGACGGTAGKAQCAGTCLPGVFSTGHSVQCGHQASCSALGIPSFQSTVGRYLATCQQAQDRSEARNLATNIWKRKGSLLRQAMFIPFLNRITPRNIQIWDWRACSAGKVLAVCIWGSEFSSPVVQTCNPSTGVQRQEDPWGL